MVIFISLFCGELSFAESNNNNFRFNGYIQDMPSIDFTKGVDGYNFNNVLHNRLNFRYSPTDNLRFAFEIRNRLISGDMVESFSPFLVEMLEHDSGLIDASYVPFSGDKWLFHTMSDRFYADWRYNNLQVRIGRQRINWGINMVSNPNDLFNTYSFFDIDYPERPGADAIRVQYFTGDMSRFDFAFSPDRDFENSTAALMYAFNKRAYDFQFVGGYYRNRLALGAGLAGSIYTTGFKGEVTLFNDFDKFDNFDYIDIVAAISFDHIFPNTMYVLFEALYNGGYKNNAGNLLMLTEPMSPDNIFISKYALTGSLTYPISPILTTSLAGVYMPDINAFYVSPNVTYSVVTNLDASLLAQYFYFNDEIEIENIAIFMRLKWSF